MRIIECIRNIMSLPKTLFLNFYYLPIKRAVRIPIRCCYNVKIHSLGGRNCVILLDDSARVRIGFSSSYGMGDKTIWTIEKGAKVVFLGGAIIGKGTTIFANGNLVIGRDFFCNADCKIICNHKIEFGDGVLLGWNVTVMDGDGHRIQYKDIEKEKYESVSVGDHVWLAANSTVLKGGKISARSVIAFRGIVSKNFSDTNVMIGEINRIIKHDVSWEK